MGGIAVDDAGYIYVTGTSWGSGTGNDIVTIKYSPDGESLWAFRYDGPAHGNDEARGLAVKNGKVVVVGGSADANLFTNIVTIVYNTAGETLWTALYDSPTGGNDLGLTVTVDDSGNVLVGGYASGDTTGWDLVALKYSPNGRLEWTGSFVTIEEDYAARIAVMANGDVAVAGNSGNPYYLTWDYVVIRFNGSTGDTVWTERYDGPASERDEVRGMVLTPDGSLYLTGGSMGTGSGMDFTTIKYSLDGNLLWERRYNGPANSIDWANDIAVDGDGNIYVTGYSQGVASDCDYATVKYDANGNEQWVQRYDGPVAGYDEARAIVVDDGGNIYITGSSTGAGTRADYATVKYDFSGNQEWIQRYNGPASRFDEAVAVVLDDNGGVYITGNSEGNGTGNDFATIRYEAIGIGEMLANPKVNPFNPVRIVSNRKLPSPVSGFLLDAVGNRVMEVKPGENEISNLPAGVYFVTGGFQKRPPIVKLVVVK